MNNKKGKSLMKSVMTGCAAAVSLAAIVAAASSSAAQRTDMQQQNPSNGDIQTVPGYYPRPPGMCWQRQGGGGQENNGYWVPCRERGAARQNRTTGSLGG
jgi:hypothetical protein